MHFKKKNLPQGEKGGNIYQGTQLKKPHADKAC